MGRAKPGKRSAKLALFVVEYLIDFNGRRAAIRAGCAKASAHVTASRWLKDPWVKGQIRREQASRRKRLRMSADDVELELCKIGRSNMFDYIEPDGSLDLTKPTYDQAAAIQSIQVNTFEMAGSGPVEENGRPPVVVAKITKFRLYSKVPALELLGKRHKMFSEQVEHTGKVTVVVDL